MAAGLLLVAQRPLLAQDRRLAPETGLRPEPEFPLRPLSPEQQLRLSDTQARFIVMRNPQTAENIDSTYFSRGRYEPRALQALNSFCRDWRAQATIEMDTALFDILAHVQRLADFAVIEMLSGYRTAETNAWLATQDVDVAWNSQHILGKAIDFRIGDIPIATLATWAEEAGAGGIGVYPTSRFVHVDTGPPRRWQGS